MKNHTCCFLGHRKIEKSDKLIFSLKTTIENLIQQEGVDTFLFGSKSQFNTLSHEIISELKKAYPAIKRVYVRSHFAEISEDYKNFLLQNYEATYFPKKILNAGKSSYVERNFEMIDKSTFCIVYFNKNYSPEDGPRKSGTKIAYDYAIKKNKKIINVFFQT